MNDILYVENLELPDDTNAPWGPRKHMQFIGYVFKNLAVPKSYGFLAH